MLCTGMGYRDDREALIAERNGLRRDLAERTAELEALKAGSDENQPLARELAHEREVATDEKAPSEVVGAMAPSPPRRSGVVAAVVVGTLAVGALAVSYYGRTREDDSHITEPRAAAESRPQEPSERGRSDAQVRPRLQSCVPEGSRETFYVRVVVSDTGVVTSATIDATSLGPLVEDTPASTCVEAAVLGQSLPLLRDVTVMLPIEPSLPEDMVWAVAIANMSRP